MDRVFSPVSVLIFSAICDMYFDLASRMAMLRRRYASVSSRFVVVGSMLVGSRAVFCSAVTRSMVGCSVSLLMSNHALRCLSGAMLVAFAVSPTILKKVV